MAAVFVGKICEHFESVTDPRLNRGGNYPLIEQLCRRYSYCFRRDVSLPSRFWLTRRRRPHQQGFHSGLNPRHWQPRAFVKDGVQQWEMESTDENGKVVTGLRGTNTRRKE